MRYDVRLEYTTSLSRESILSMPAPNISAPTSTHSTREPARRTFSFENVTARSAPRYTAIIAPDSHIMENVRTLSLSLHSFWIITSSPMSAAPLTAALR